MINTNHKTGSSVEWHVGTFQNPRCVWIHHSGSLRKNRYAMKPTDHLWWWYGNGYGLR